MVHLHFGGLRAAVMPVGKPCALPRWSDIAEVRCAGVHIVACLLQFAPAIARESEADSELVGRRQGTQRPWPNETDNRLANARR